jgi:hypothetical protein
VVGGEKKSRRQQAGLSLLERGASTAWCGDKRGHVLHCRCRKVLYLTLRSFLASGYMLLAGTLIPRSIEALGIKVCTPLYTLNRIAGNVREAVLAS